MKGEIIIFLLLLLIPTIGQSQHLDSLKYQITHEPDELKKLTLYKELNSSLIFTAPREGVFYCKLMLNLAEAINNDHYSVLSNRYLGIAYSQLNNFEQAIASFNAALAVSENSNGVSLEDKGKLYNNLGLAYSSSKDYTSALQYLQQSINIKKELKDKKGIATSYNNIGLVYYNMKDYESALNYYYKSLELRKQMGSGYEIGSSYLNIGGVCYWMKDFDKANEFYDSAISLLENTKYYRKLFISYRGKILALIRLKRFDETKLYIEKAFQLSNTLDYNYLEARIWKLKGEVEFEQGQLPEAEVSLLRSLDLADTTQHAGQVHLLLGNIYMLTNKKPALHSFKRALEISKLQNETELQSDAYLQLSKFHDQQKQYKQAYLYYKKHTHINDSLSKTNNIYRIKDLQLRFESKEKEVEIAALSQEKENYLASLLWQRNWLAGLFVISILVAVYALKGIRNLQFKHEKEQKTFARQQLNHVEKTTLLEGKIKSQNRELTSKSMFILERSQGVNKSIQQLNGYKKYLGLEVRKKYSKILEELANTQDPNSWKAFEKYFLETHQGFYKNLESKFPNLTPSDKKLCAFLRLKLSTKEIATLLHLSPKSVEVARSRLRKKLSLTDTNISLVNFLSRV